MSHERLQRDLMGVPRDVSRYVDIGFPVRGRTFPLDHGYCLFAGVAREIPAFHDQDGGGGERWGLHPILGTKTGPDELTLVRASMLKVRAPVDDVGVLLPLAGKTLDLAGHEVSLSIPRIFPLVPATTLKARMVTIKGFLDAKSFESALRRKLAMLPDLGQDPERIEILVGRIGRDGQRLDGRRVMRLGTRKIVGFSVSLSGLVAKASIAVQAYGLGGRRHMGAGIFVPLGRRERG